MSTTFNISPAQTAPGRNTSNPLTETNPNATHARAAVAPSTIPSSSSTLSETSSPTLVHLSTPTTATAPPTAHPSLSSELQSRHCNIGAIIGGTVGGLLLLAAAVLCVFLVRRRRKRHGPEGAQLLGVDSQGSGLAGITVHYANQEEPRAQGLDETPPESILQHVLFTDTSEESSLNVEQTDHVVSEKDSSSTTSHRESLAHAESRNSQLWEPAPGGREEELFRRVQEQESYLHSLKSKMSQISLSSQVDQSSNDSHRAAAALQRMSSIRDEIRRLRIELLLLHSSLPSGFGAESDSSSCMTSVQQRS
ncbi:hypothetical protein OE88DRAFT_1664841 [Heliocybe sulcata]|uniref:Mid2 domain-containing protein n=1 Tax=Heliocybe sulcata TaxID=5364 RepID=A0A5C3MSF4_9AGAM|nr:hypothetical protein OE88DRAFT_1664841 [Heliocybe sulcata]